MARGEGNRRRRYAVWSNHGRKCWNCGRPLLFHEMTVDHFLPKKLSKDDAKKRKILREFKLHDDFNIDGYENLLPACTECNNDKDDEIPPATRENRDRIIYLMERSHSTRKIADSFSKNITKESILHNIFDGLEQQRIGINDLIEFIHVLETAPDKAGVPDGTIILEGYWYDQKRIKRQGICQCEQEKCTGMNHKVYCYFHDELNPWIIGTGLFWRCYDEKITCPRCGNVHKRGHIGSDRFCSSPFLEK